MIKNDFLLKQLHQNLSNSSYWPLVKNCLQGSPQKVFSIIEKRMVEEQDPIQKRFLLHLQWLAENYSYNLFPDMTGGDALELSDKWNQETLQLISDQMADLQSDLHTLSSNEEDLLSGLLAGLQSQRSFFRGTIFKDDSFDDSLLNVCVTDLGQKEDQFLQKSAAIYCFHFLYLVRAELYYKAGLKDESSDILNQLYSENDELNAVVGMIWSDYDIAPISSPLVWNRSIQTNTAAANDLPWQVEEMEIFGHLEYDIEDTLKQYNETEQYYIQQNDIVGQAHLLLRYAYIHFLQEEYKEALVAIEKAMELAQKANHLFLFQIAQTQQVLMKITLGNRSIPKKILDQIADWGKEDGSFSFALGLGVFMTRMGRYWLLKKSDVDQALTCFSMAQYLFEQLEARTNSAQSYFDIGQLYETIGDTNNATYYYEKGLSVFEQVINDSASKIRKDVYRIYMMAANELLSLYMKNMDGEGIQRTVERIELLLAKDINSLAAFNDNAAMDSMIEMYINQSLSQGRVFAPLYKAVTARDKGETTKAESFFEKTSYQITQAAVNVQHFYNGVLAGQQRRFDEAKQHFVNYLNQGGGGMMGAFLDMFKQAGENRYQQEVVKQDQRTMEMAFTFMVRVKAYGDALKYAKKVEALAGGNWWQTQARPWESLGDYGELYEGLNDYDNALYYYDLAINILEDRRASLSKDEMKSAIGSGKGIQYLYFYAARTAIKAGYKERSLEYIELNKARALVELLEPQSAKGNNETVWQQWQGLNAKANLLKTLMAKENKKQAKDTNRITFLNQELASIQQETNELNQQMPQQQKQFLDNTEQQQFQITDVSKCLSYDTLVVEYFMLSESLLIWVIAKNGLKTAITVEVDDKAVNRKITAFHKACQDRTMDWKKLAQELSAILLNPIKRFLDQDRYTHLQLIPHGVMHKLPFSALMWQGAPLFTRFTISSLPSAHLISLLHAGKKKQNKRALVIGNPANMAYKADFSAAEPVAQEALHNAEIEAIYIASQFPEHTLLLGADATEKAVLENIEQHSILVFSTHGILSEAAPLNSSILLADGQSIALFELMGLDIDAELVVLSACETALGEITGGDDVIGLSRGWFAAGARSVLVSLWSINDRSTSLFMTKLFDHYQNEGKSILDAIQTAQQYLFTLDKEQGGVDFGDLCDKIKQLPSYEETERGLGNRNPRFEVTNDYSHPYYWAGFLYLGVG